MDYGTGAVMSVPAHDQRDYEFAVKYNLNIKTVILPVPGGIASETGRAYEEKGILTDSGQFSGLASSDAIKTMNKYAEEHEFGRAAVDYKLKDWCLSRQRFWGTPIPTVYCDSCGVVMVPEAELPVMLPDVEALQAEGNPLAAVPEFVNTKCPRCGKPARRETDTMDTFIDSSWYQLRYCDPKIKTAMVNKAAITYWSPVDIYIGGIEHAVGHLMYFRWFYKRLRDLNLVGGDEPVKRLLTQGMVIKDGAKMSKSKGNVVDPDDMIKRYGADTTRMFSLFAAPPEKDLEWNESGVEGLYRFLKRVWSLVQTHSSLIKTAAFPTGKERFADAEIKLRRKTHQTIKRVTKDVELRLHFNTAIAAIMELLNEVYAFDLDRNENAAGVLKEAVYNMIILLGIFAPHIAEELYEQIGGTGLVAEHSWPKWDEEIAAEEIMTIAIQINGKLRSNIAVPVNSDEQTVIKLATEDKRTQSHIEGMEVIKRIYVPGKIINFVVKKK
jgi:leucyl-tRNA synthetase